MECAVFVWLPLIENPDPLRNVLCLCFLEVCFEFTASTLERL